LKPREKIQIMLN